MPAKSKGKMSRRSFIKLSGAAAAAAAALVRAAARVEAAGADFLVLCTNTMHKVAPQIEQANRIPLLHIADATADAVHRAGVDSVALLGTRYTMEQGFYRERLVERGLAVIVPAPPDRALVHGAIFDELVQGRVEHTSKLRFLEIIDRLFQQGAEGVVAGCTEIELLVNPDDLDRPYFPTTRIHAIAAVDAALA